MAITKNIVTDYGADNTGATDVGPKFYTNLKADMAGQDCNLTVPAGTYKFDTSPGGFFWASGMTSLNVTATGSTWVEGTEQVILGSQHLTGIGIDNVAGQSARIQSAAAGATSVTLTAASASAGHISRATVGNWILVAGFDIQGLFLSAYGFPPNAHFFDYVQITAVDTTNKIISFTPALRESYSAQWPEFNRGSAFEVDSGGPATVYFLNADWGCTKDFNGGTYRNTNFIHAEGKDVTFRNGNHTGSNAPIYPSVNKNWTATNHDTSDAEGMEIDKFIENFTFDGGPANAFGCQSSSCTNMTIKNTAITTHVTGTGRNTLIDNCTIGGNLWLGCDQYGRSDTITVRNTSVTGTINQIQSREQGPDGLGVQVWSMSNGIITIPLSGNGSLGRSLPPDPRGRNVLLWENGSSDTIGSFQVLGVTADPWPAADNQSATTNITSASSSYTITVSTNLFTAADIGKVILVQGASSVGAANSHKTFITGVSAFSGGAQNITVAHAATRSQSAVSGTVQWGTANVYVQTNQTGGFPSASLYGASGKLFMRVPAARSITFENVTGSALATDMSQVAARGRPWATYTKRTFNGTETGLSFIELIGNIVSVKVNVITPYTGTQPTFWVALRQFGLPVVQGGALTTWDPRVNLKIAGERVITVGSTTGTQSGDSNLTLSSATWSRSSYAASPSQNITGESASVYPSYTIEIITDTGAQAQIAPLRLRLRA